MPRITYLPRVDVVAAAEARCDSLASGSAIAQMSRSGRPCPVTRPEILPVLAAALAAVLADWASARPLASPSAPACHSLAGASSLTCPGTTVTTGGKPGQA